MRLRIHRGAEEIGGNCIELEAEGKSLLLDLGAPLMGEKYGIDALPQIRGLTDGSNPNLLGIVISHPHADHYGLAKHAHPSLPVFIGMEADKLLRAAIAFSPFGAMLPNVHHYEGRKSFTIGPFRVTAFLADHSGFDSYSLLIEADGKSIFYSGDIRGHGWKCWAFQALLDSPPSPVDVMFLEGTTLGRSDTEPMLSEADLIAVVEKKMAETEGIVLATFSGQNIDRFVTFYKAALKCGRTFVVDLYIAHLLRAIGRKSLPDPTTRALRVFLPRRTKMKIVRDRNFDLVEPYRHRRIFPNELKRRRGSLVMSFRPTMYSDVLDADCLSGARVIYSMWPGYLEQSQSDFRQWCGDNNVRFDIVHSSGHASARDLKRLVSAINPKALIPIHTLASNRFHEFGANVMAVPNGR